LTEEVDLIAQYKKNSNVLTNQALEARRKTVFKQYLNTALTVHEYYGAIR